MGSSFIVVWHPVGSGTGCPVPFPFRYRIIASSARAEVSASEYTRGLGALPETIFGATCLPSGDRSMMPAGPVSYRGPTGGGEACVRESAAAKPLLTSDSNSLFISGFVDMFLPCKVFR